MFQLKQFSVEDAHSSMKVGTDAVLLGCLAHADTSTPAHILDIGTGCGLIALMMAQRFPSATIDAIDIDENSVCEAASNFSASPWCSRLQPHHTSLQTYTTSVRYNLIVSNPPFFANSLKGPNTQRNMARHNETLLPHILLDCVSALLAPNGAFCCILPCLQASQVITDGRMRHQLQCTSQVDIRNFADSQFKRTFFTLQQSSSAALNVQTLTLRNPDNSYTEAHRELTKEFYLAL